MEQTISLRFAGEKNETENIGTIKHSLAAI
jgi:hypothetical protein